MPYIACPACSERIGISYISFKVDAEAQLCDVLETDDEVIRCPHCKAKYTISMEVDFCYMVNITSEDRTYRDFLDIEWEGEGSPALEYYDEPERYEITHEGGVVRTHASKNPNAVRKMTNWMIEISDENAGEFSLYYVEIDPETGHRNYTRIASAKNGVKI